MKMVISCLVLVSAFLFLSRTRANDRSGNSCYTVETVGFPGGVPLEVGAMGLNEDGELVVALRRGNILIGKLSSDPDATDWRVFAQALHNACGMHVVSRSEVIVSQMPELTRIVDTDGDGQADLYENLYSEWGIGGNYHEINSLVSDGAGGYYVALGTASYNSPTYYHVRGGYSKIGRRGRNYSAVSWKGWLLHIDQTGETTPWSSGFRMQNGILLDRDGNLWSGDNQGDWKGTTPFYHLRRGHFKGTRAAWCGSQDGIGRRIRSSFRPRRGAL